MTLTQAQKDRAEERRFAIMRAAVAAGYVPNQSRGQLAYESYVWGSRLLVHNALVEACETKGSHEKAYLQEIMAKGSNQAPQTRGGYSVFDFSDRTLKALQWLEKHGLVLLDREDFGVKRWQAVPLTGRIDSLEELQDLAKDWYKEEGT